MSGAEASDEDGRPPCLARKTLRSSSRLKPPKSFYLIIVVCAVWFVLLGLLNSYLGTTAAFYVAVPFAVPLLLHHFVGPAKKSTVLGRYLIHLRNATIVFVAVSALLFEGFICVLFTMPIYYLIVTIGYTSIYFYERASNNDRSRVGAYALPVIVAILSLEGVTPATTLERANSVTYAATVDAPVRDLKANMTRPIAFDLPRGWLITVFPLPSHGGGGPLATGYVHTLNFNYKRWLFTNEHEGKLRLRITAVGEHHVETEIIGDDSYLASYMNIKRTLVRFDEADGGGTKVSLTIFYDRLLDPVWYFGPLQRLAMRQSAKYLLESVIARQAVRA